MPMSVFKCIMVPIDLYRPETMSKALVVAAGVAKQFDVPVHLVGVTVVPPSQVAHSPEEYREKLARFAQERTNEFGVPFQSMAIPSNDPAVDLDKQLQRAAGELSADLIVMASHVPHFGDWLLHSHARWLAAHTDRSIFIVR